MLPSVAAVPSADGGSGCHGSDESSVDLCCDDCCDDDGDGDGDDDGDGDGDGDSNCNEGSGS